MAGGSERAQARPEVTQQKMALCTVGVAALDSRWERVREPLGAVGLAGALGGRREPFRALYQNNVQHLDTTDSVPGVC